MKKNIVIVGAGMAGSLLVKNLAQNANITLIELCKENRRLVTKIESIGLPIKMDLHAASGLGGTTNYWMNGLMCPADEDLSDWPISRQEIDPYLESAYAILSGKDRDTIETEASKLKQIQVERGIPASMMDKLLYYPKRRRNVWVSEGVGSRKIETIFGKALKLNLSDHGSVETLQVQVGDRTVSIAGDAFILCAGGLSTSLILQSSVYQGQPVTKWAGRYYHDHPNGFVGSMRINMKLYDVWNYSNKIIEGNLRTPFVIKEDGHKFAIYLRPIVTFNSQIVKRKFKSVLLEIANNPFNLRLLKDLFTNIDDIVEIISFKLNRHIPTNKFAILVAGSQPRRPDLSIYGSHDGNIIRNWIVDEVYLGSMRRAVDRFIAALGPNVEEAHLFPDWESGIDTGAHHSGACRMALNAEEGVVDKDLKVFGVDNLYVCDGSVIPSSGFTNTGLMIAALALRLATKLNESIA